MKAANSPRPSAGPRSFPSSSKPRATPTACARIRSASMSIPSTGRRSSASEKSWTEADWSKMQWDAQVWLCFLFSRSPAARPSSRRRSVMMTTCRRLPIFRCRQTTMRVRCMSPHPGRRPAAARRAIRSQRADRPDRDGQRRRPGRAAAGRVFQRRPGLSLQSRRALSDLRFTRADHGYSARARRTANRFGAARRRRHRALDRR